MLGRIQGKLTQIFWKSRSFCIGPQFKLGLVVCEYRLDQNYTHENYNDDLGTWRMLSGTFGIPGIRPRIW